MQNKTNLNNQSVNGIKTNMIWHRRLGLSTFVVLIFLAISGFALNHSPGLKLNQISLSSNWLLSWYGLELPATEAFNLGESWIYQDGDKTLWVDGKSVAPCTAPLFAAAETADMLFALCADGLLLLTTEGQFVERFSTVDGLPANSSGLTVLDNRIYLTVGLITTEFNPSSFELTATDVAPETLTGSQKALLPLPKPLQKSLRQQSVGASISLETLILDLHSGRFFGQFGVLFVDLIGLLVCILSITGLAAWIKRR
jgi:hypothetical protein